MKKIMSSALPFSLALAAMMLLGCGSQTKLSGGVQKGKEAAATPTPTPTPAPKAETPVVSKPKPAEEKPVVATPPVVSKPPVEGAIQKGSFTVWTEPKDPKPFRDYSIFVQVALPPNTVDYKLDDLDGNLIGTDGYVQAFGGNNKSRSFEVTGNTALVEIRVPGSYFLVRDTIDVTSTLLNESQEIVIVF